MVPGKVKFNTVFIYNGRPIHFFKRSSRIGYIYIFQDPMVRAEKKSSVTQGYCLTRERYEIL
ncbi:MAG: hypothetical protein QW783_02820, partial [Candidatus Micrarchaeia archaeon]